MRSTVGPAVTSTRRDVYKRQHQRGANHLRHVVYRPDINALCARKKLCKTSATPGKTRLINIFLINEAFHLVDLPGYGFAKVNQAEKQRWGEMMDGYFQDSTLLRHVQMCIRDSRGRERRQ